MTASGFTRPAAMRLVDASFGTAALTAPSGAMKVHVTTTAPTESAAGTDLGSTTFPSLTMASATNANPPVAANSGTVTVTAGAGGSVTGVDIWDSGGTPFRWQFGQLGTARTVITGDSLVFAASALQFSLAPST